MPNGAAAGLRAVRQTSPAAAAPRGRAAASSPFSSESTAPGCCLCTHRNCRVAQQPVASSVAALKAAARTVRKSGLAPRSVGAPVSRRPALAPASVAQAARRVAWRAPAASSM